MQVNNIMPSTELRIPERGPRSQSHSATTAPLNGLFEAKGYNRWRQRRGLFHPILALPFVFIMLAGGCRDATPKKPAAATPATPNAAASVDAGSNVTGESSAADSTTKPEPVEPAHSIALQELDWQQLQELVTSHKGKVVVVDLWSTSCEPCLREFPHLVALQKQYPKDVICISYDCDFIGAKNKPVIYYRERVLKFLEGAGASGVVNTMSTVAADELFVQIDVDSIPAVYVYDQAGKLAKRFDNRTPASPTEEGISYETQIAPLVSDLVKAAQN